MDDEIQIEIEVGDAKACMATWPKIKAVNTREKLSFSVPSTILPMR